jgi:hypothetical protein
MWGCFDLTTKSTFLALKGLKSKGKAFPQKHMGTHRGDGILGFHPYFDIRHDQDGRVVSSRCRPFFTPQGNFLVLLAEWTPGVENADRMAG